VSAPVDAFFVNRFDLKGRWPKGKMDSLFIGAGAEGCLSFFPLPFAGHAKLTLENTGDTPVTVEATAAYEPLAALPAGAMLFHAEYRQHQYETDRDPKRTITTHTPIDPATNYVVAEVQGTGHYIGTAIFVESLGRQWWGEGDEWTWVDGAEKPVILGTGTEDEFNWSWGFGANMSPVSGTLPVVPDCKGLARFGVPNRECEARIGHNIAYRFRPTDYVAFGQSIKVSYEVLGASMTPVNNPVKGNWSQWRGDDYSSMAYWYQLP
jgi:hypothetical protein